MEKTAYSFGFKEYALLTKPGIVMGNAMTALAGFALGLQGHFPISLFLATLAGVSCVIASACVFNNAIDRNADQKMQRTKNRALATGSVSVRCALFFAVVLLMVGVSSLECFVNRLSLGIALFGFITYVLLYSYSKYYSRHGTLIGSLAGAVPPVIGYTAASNQIDSIVLLFFAMMVLWQMPHFFAITIFRLKEYASASIPVLPLQKGINATKNQIIVYITAFLIATLFLPFLHPKMGFLYCAASLSLGLYWLYKTVVGYRSEEDHRWARKTFVSSLYVILGLSTVIFISAML